MEAGANNMDKKGANKCGTKGKRGGKRGKQVVEPREGKVEKGANKCGTKGKQGWKGGQINVRTKGKRGGKGGK